MSFHSFEDQILVEDVNGVEEGVRDVVTLELNSRKKDVFKLSLVSTEVGHDFHADVQ